MIEETERQLSALTGGPMKAALERLERRLVELVGNEGGELKQTMVP
jgi:hypothetical protein